jgi:type I restriction enzyme S subunit
MSSEWTVCRLADLISIKHGFAFKGEYFSDVHTPYQLTTPGNFAVGGGFQAGKGKYYSGPIPEDYILRIGDVIVTMTDLSKAADTLGYAAAVPKTNGIIWLHNQRVGLVQVKPNALVNLDYLQYLMRSKEYRHWVVASATGSTVKHTSPGRICEFECTMPPVCDQEEIACVLGALDVRIALLRETNTTLEAIAQTLFKSWFVDFDPVHAKKQGREPEGMDSDTAALFPGSFEESELGLVPKGWQIGNVADIGEVICGKTPATSEPANYGDDVPFITIPDMHGLLSIISTRRSLSVQGANTQKKKTLPIGSICVSCIATAGLVARVATPSQTNQQINSVVPFAKWGNSFPLFTLRRIGDAVRAGGSGGSVFHNLNKSGFEQLKVLFPIEQLALAFSEIVEPIIEKIIANQKQAQTLATLRDTLLPRLISGQLRLPEVLEISA